MKFMVKSVRPYRTQLAAIIAHSNDIDLARTLAHHPWRPEAPIRFWYHYETFGWATEACFVEMRGHPDNLQYEQGQVQLTAITTAAETSDDDEA